MRRRYGRFVLSTYLVVLITFVASLYLDRFENYKEATAMLNTLFFVSIFATLINSRKHEDIGQVFQVRKSYRLFSFIRYDSKNWINLPLIFIILSFNYIFALSSTLFVLIFNDINWYPLIIFIASILVLSLLLILIESVIYRVRK